MPNQTYFDQSNLAAFNWVIFDIPYGRRCYTLTGVFVVNLQGSSQNWLRQKIYMSIPIPGMAQGQGLHIEQWAPLFTLNSIYNKDTSVNNGDAIDDFNLSSRELDPNYGDATANFYADIAIRDSDAFIYRIGFNVTLTGYQKPVRPVIIQ
jgi:hypothetical protein